MGVDEQPLPGVEQLDQQGRLGAERRGVVRPEEAFGVVTQRVAHAAVPSGSRASPISSWFRAVAAEPIQSSLWWSPISSSPRNAAIFGPPRKKRCRRFGPSFSGALDSVRGVLPSGIEVGI